MFINVCIVSIDNFSAVGLNCSSDKILTSHLVELK